MLEHRQILGPGRTLHLAIPDGQRGRLDHKFSQGTPQKTTIVLVRARTFLQAGYALQEKPEWGCTRASRGIGPGKYQVGRAVDLNDRELDEFIQFAAGVQILQRVRFQRSHYSTMLIIIPVAGYSCGFIWKIESLTFDKLRTWDRNAEWDESMKTAVAGRVFGLASACNADGFVLRPDDNELRIFSSEEIYRSLTRTNYNIDDPLDASALIGLSNLPPNRVHGGQGPSKHYYTVFGRYTVMDLLHRPKPTTTEMSLYRVHNQTALSSMTPTAWWRASNPMITE
jgi:hypothetical protein